MVVSTDLQKQLDLSKIILSMPDAEYNPRRFPGLVIRVKNPKATVLVFASGRIVCNGAKSKDQCEKAVKFVLKRLEENEFLVLRHDIPTITVQNIVASINLRAKIMLEKAARSIPRSMYEPEQFPGIILRTGEKSKATLLVFSSGKIVCTGIKQEDDLYRTIRSLQDILEQKNLVEDFV